MRSGVCAGAVDGDGVEPILDEYRRTRVLSGVGAAGDGAELRFGVGLTFLDEPGSGVEFVDGRLERDWISRRRAAMRSTRDCRPVVFRPETPDDPLLAIGLDEVPGPMRLAIPFVAFELMPLRTDG